MNKDKITRAGLEPATSWFLNILYLALFTYEVYLVECTHVSSKHNEKMAPSEFTVDLESSLYISRICLCILRAVCRGAVYSAPNVQHWSRVSKIL